MYSELKDSLFVQLAIGGPGHLKVGSLGNWETLVFQMPFADRMLVVIIFS